MGLLGAIQLAPEVLEQDAGAVAKLTQGARDAGVLVRPLQAFASSIKLLFARDLANL